MNSAIELLRRRNKVILKTDNGNEVNDNQITAFIYDLSQFGYTIGQDVIGVLKTNSTEMFTSQCELLIHNLKVLKRAHVRYSPLFADFPNVEVNDLQLFRKRVIGCIQNMFDIREDDHEMLSCGHFVNTSLFNLEKYGACPICLNQVDELDSSDDHLPPLRELTPTQIINVGCEADLWNIFSNLLSSKTPISETDVEYIEYLMASRRDESLKYVPDEVALKENVARIITFMHKYCSNVSNHQLKFIKTATDVLRVAVGLSGGDVTLVEKSRFKLSNSQRRLIMSLLDNIDNPLEDMKRYRMKWIRLGEVLHIGSHQKRYPTAYANFDILRNNERTIKTFNGEIEKFITIATRTCNIPHDKVEEVLDLLKTRPGDFGRRLDKILRLFENPFAVPYNVINRFKSVVSKISTPVLLTISAHFRNRSRAAEFRAFVPKEKIANMHFVEGDNRKVLSEETCYSVTDVIADELYQRFISKKMGNVYIDPSLEGLIIPFSQRSASKSISAVERGSRIKLSSDCDTIRMFTYWKGTHVDLDLSAIAYDDEWNYKTHISYTRLSSFGTKHSGDITSAPNGASEFIDVDLNKIRKKGVRYVVMNLISYTGDAFDTFECFSGIMERNKGDDGRRFEPTTVKTKFDITGAYKYNVPLILDVVKKEFIWTDYSVSTQLKYANVENSMSGVTEVSRYANSLIENRHNLFDLFATHALANGASIDTVFDENKDYDYVFDFEYAKKTDEIVSKWL